MVENLVLTLLFACVGKGHITFYHILSPMLIIEFHAKQCCICFDLFFVFFFNVFCTFWLCHLVCTISIIIPYKRVKSDEGDIYGFVSRKEWQ